MASHCAQTSQIYHVQYYRTALPLITTLAKNRIAHRTVVAFSFHVHTIWIKFRETTQQFSSLIISWNDVRRSKWFFFTFAIVSTSKCRLAAAVAGRCCCCQLRNKIIQNRLTRKRKTKSRWILNLCRRCNFHTAQVHWHTAISLDNVIRVRNSFASPVCRTKTLYFRWHASSTRKSVVSVWPRMDRVAGKFIFKLCNNNSKTQCSKVDI